MPHDLDSSAVVRLVLQIMGVKWLHDPLDGGRIFGSHAEDYQVTYVAKDRIRDFAVCLREVLMRQYEPQAILASL